MLAEELDKSGSIFLAGVAGLLTSYAVLPPRMPAENGVESADNN